jgi:hypothetical protein
MKLLEVPAALRRATKKDLFTGDINNMKSVQAIRENATIFERSKITNNLEGPYLLQQSQSFSDLYFKMTFGMLGVITQIPNRIGNELLFDLVLREASVEDFKYNSKHIRYNRMYYTYADKKLLGPFYTDNSTTGLFIESLLAKTQAFVPNERQHFKKKEYKKSA